MGEKFVCFVSVVSPAPKTIPCVLSSFSRVRLFATLWTITCQAPLSSGFSRQEYQSGLSFPTPGDLPNPGIESKSPASPTLVGGFFQLAPPGKPIVTQNKAKY